MIDGVDDTLKRMPSRGAGAQPGAYNQEKLFEQILRVGSL